VRYRPLDPISRADVQSALDSSDLDTLVAGINYVAGHDDDWHWVLDLLAQTIHHPSPEVRAASARGLATLARVHPNMPVDAISRMLQESLGDPQVAAYTEDALSDIRTFRRKNANDPRAEIVDSLRAIAEGKIRDLTSGLAPLGPDLERELDEPDSEVIKSQRERDGLRQLVETLDAVLASVPPDASDAAVVNNPAWQRVVQSARVALEELERR
jgi:hypothetical protein